MNKRTIIIVLDSFGVGELPDAKDYGDEGSNTFRGIYNEKHPNLPNMKKLGLYNIQDIGIEESSDYVEGSFCKLKELSKGKNSPVGHWEISGFVKEVAFSTFPNGFPEDLLNEVISRSGIPGFICNKKGSGTDFLKQYGEESIQTRMPIVYTSADSVFQIAAHEDVYSVEELYRICRIAREVIDEKKYNIGTVIARPFIGTNAENFQRTYNRKDFEAQDFGKTMLDIFEKNNKKVLSIGKIEDLFSGRGIYRAIHTNGNTDGILKTIDEIKNGTEDMIFTNLVDFDMLYGHRNNVEGYSKALEEFDSYLPEIISSMRENDILMITADHGCDPTTPSTDHSREYIPLLIYGKCIKENNNIGIKGCFSDIAATILDWNQLEKTDYGTSFLSEIIK